VFIWSPGFQDRVRVAPGVAQLLDDEAGVAAGHATPGGTASTICEKAPGRTEPVLVFGRRKPTSSK
jgi:hypothetical protein